MKSELEATLSVTARTLEALVKKQVLSVYAEDIIMSEIGHIRRALDKQAVSSAITTDDAADREQAELNADGYAVRDGLSWSYHVECFLDGIKFERERAQSLLSPTDSSFDISSATKAGMEAHGDLAFIFADGALWQHMQSRLSPTDSGFHPGTDEALHRTEIAQFEIEVAELTTERDALKAEVETANANAFHLELKHNEVAKELKACREAYEAARDRARGCIQAGYDHMGKTYLGIAAVTEFETQLAAIFAQYDTTEKK